MAAPSLLAVFEAVATGGPLTLAAVVERTNLPSTTAHRQLRVLAAAGWVSPAPGAGRPRWEVAARLRVMLGGGAAALAATARPALRRLAGATGESAQLWAADAAFVQVLAAEEAPAALRASWPEGTRLASHTCAAGKVSLAALADADVRRLGGAGLAPATVRTVMDPEVLVLEVREARRRGWAAARSEEAEGVSSVAAAVGSQVLAAGAGAAAVVSVTGPSERVDGRLGELADAVRAVAVSLGETGGR